MIDTDINDFPAVAAKLVDLLAVLPDGVIAGGFLRDVVLGKPARDIDLFIERIPLETELDAIAALLGKGVEFAQMSPPDLEDYAPEECRNSNIITVFKDDSHDLMDIIVVSNLKEHLRTFPDSLSKIYFSLEAGLHTSHEFHLTLADGIIRCAKDISDARVEKLQRKFPEFQIARVNT